MFHKNDKALDRKEKRAHEPGISPAESSLSSLTTVTSRVHRQTRRLKKQDGPSPVKTEELEPEILSSQVMDSDLKSIMDGIGELVEEDQDRAGIQEDTTTNRAPSESLAQALPFRRTTPFRANSMSSLSSLSSPKPEASESNKLKPILVVEERVSVTIKKEGLEGQDLSLHSSIKSENGRKAKLDMKPLVSRPHVEVEAKYHGRGWTRTVISRAHGGNTQRVEHHWKARPNSKPAFLTMNRSWNAWAPDGPGQHGVGFLDLSDRAEALGPISIFVGEGTNDWRLYGTYKYHRKGELSISTLKSLPRCLAVWVNGIVESSAWGQEFIDEANAALNQTQEKIEKTSPESVEAALLDGRLVIPFTVLECVGFPEGWFEELEKAQVTCDAEAKAKAEAEAKAKADGTWKPPPPKTQRKKRRGPDTQGAPRKRVKREKVKVVKTESEAEYDEEQGDEDDDYVPRYAVKLPTRTSPRKALRRTSDAQ
ncbi:hypothetical protein C8F01DRAFT_1164012 [Mycena amicta]|nr:hypothetical protein C8F01DRAFT_1164012 [Mycena amicta]